MKKEQSKAEWRVGRHIFTIPASALYATLFPNPHSVGMTARGIGKFVEALKRYGDDYDALAKRANNNIHHIASIYQLTESGAGEYILKRGSWWAGITRTDHHGVADYAPMINWQTVGLDKNLNIKSLSMYVEGKASKGRG